MVFVARCRKLVILLLTAKEALLVAEVLLVALLAAEVLQAVEVEVCWERPLRGTEFLTSSTTMRLCLLENRREGTISLHQ